MKVSKGVDMAFPTGLTEAEKRLGDLVDISEPVQNKLRDARRLDAFLRIFRTAIDFFTGGPAKPYRPQPSRVEIEYVPIDKKI